ncbi:MAG: signal transduction histidine kinase [Bradymonadia bacterium]|jgi:signal transduction histidine kinase
MSPPVHTTPSPPLESFVGATEGERDSTLLERLRRAEDRAAWIQDICAALGQYERQDELLTFVMERLTLIMDCERATLFMLEPDGQHIQSRVVAGNEITELRVKVGQGIAGWVARHGKSINLKDAYKDARFMEHYDEQTGFRTESVLCQPMRGNDGNIIGVVQALNKRRGYFSVDDESLLSAITNTASIVLQNQRLYLDAVHNTLELVAAREALEERVRRLDTLYEIQRRIADTQDVEELALRVAQQIGRAVPSYGAAVTVIERGRRQEFSVARESMDAELEPALRTWSTKTRDKALSEREVAREKEVIGCILGKTRHAAIAVPLVHEDHTYGVIGLSGCFGVDPNGSPRSYKSEDRKLLVLVANQVAPALARRLAEAQRERQSRLSAIGQMLSGVLHDVRTPLSVAQGYLQLMARSSDAEKREKYQASIQQQFRLMNDMTRELLSYARGETTLYLRTVHLHIFTEELKAQLEQEFAGRDIELTVTATYRGDAKLDDGKLIRVLFNLARNARDAMPSGGKYSVDFDRAGESLIIRCTDTGTGIPASLQPVLFEAFVTSGKPDGTGLGLAIVKKLVDEHNGEIRFESTQGEGTTFIITLPIDGAPEPVAD